MGRLVELWKTEETEARVVYSYGPSQQQSGRIACTKADGEVYLVEPVLKLSDQDDRFFYQDLHCNMTMTPNVCRWVLCLSTTSPTASSRADNVLRHDT
jgi:hypothetical protein